MFKFLKFGALAVSPLLAICLPPYFSAKEREEKTQKASVDNSITLVSKLDGSFSGSCNPLSIEKIGSAKQQTFKDFDELLIHLFPISKDLIFDSVKMHFPDEMSASLVKELKPHESQQNRQSMVFYKNAKSLEEMTNTFKQFWRAWISDWSPIREGYKRIIYTNSEFLSVLDDIPQFNSLYKCHNGTWYSFDTVSVRTKDPSISRFNFFKWISEHFGLL